MDLLNVVSNKELLEYTDNLTYKTGFVVDKYFPKQKNRYLKALIRQIVSGGDIPVMAQFHSLDAESRIGDRTNFKELELEKLPIKEKLNVTERILEAFENPTDDMKSEVIKFVFSDASNLVSRILTRMAVANAEALATGKVVIKENGINTVIDYNLPSSNKVSFTSWSDASHDIISDLQTLVDLAKSKGFVIRSAMCQSSVIKYMRENTALRGTFTAAGLIPTTERVLAAVYDAVGIQFEANDDVYKVSVNGAVKNMYPADTITFFTTPVEQVGVGACGYTPDEIAGINSSEDSLVTLTKYNTEDPVALWTKASALYVPVIRNIDGLFIATISNS